VNGGNNRSSTGNANAPEQGGDAFARILDQQLTRRGDAAAKSRAADPRAGRSEAAERSDEPRPQAPKRRDPKSPTSSTTQDQPESKAEPKTKQPEKTAGEYTTCAKPATKPGTHDTEPTAEAAAGTPATTESTASTGTTESDGQSDSAGEQSQQQPADDGTQQQPGDGTDPSETVAAGADLSLLAMLALPLPLQTVSADADVPVDATALAAGDNAATALHAGLAAQLAGSIDFSAAASGKAQGQAATGGLKFGAILNANTGDSQKAAADAVAALQDAAEELAKAADPLAQLKPESGDKAQASTPGTKKSEAAQDKAAATVTPELNAKTAASIVAPTARATGVTWSGTTNIRNELAESMAVRASGGFGADEAELANWSQYLGSGATGLSNNIAARQSAFMAQLRQNLQILPPHEQIAVQIKDAMQNGNSRLTVALHPVELGRVEVKLDIDKDKNVTATIVVDRPGTLDLLRNDAKGLERALQDAGLQTGSGSLSFNLRDSNGQNGGSQNGAGTGGSGLANGAGGSEVKAEIRADVVATADGLVDLET
jgi:hypothetical protein